jgi:hypothetical protein
MHIELGSGVAGYATARRLYFLAERVSLIKLLVLPEKAHVEVVDVSESL